VENSPASSSSSNSGAHATQKCGRNCEVDERARTRDGWRGEETERESGEFPKKKEQTCLLRLAFVVRT